MIIKLFLNYYYKSYSLLYKKDNITKEYSKYIYIEFCKIYSSV